MRSCAEHLATKPSSCGWKVTVYVSVSRESCTFLCAYGLLAEHRVFPTQPWTILAHDQKCKGIDCHVTVRSERTTSWAVCITNTGWNSASREPSQVSAEDRSRVYRNLIRLSALPARGAFYIGLPLSIADHSGSPVRAVALLSR